jgi:HEAT repeat protein
MTTEEDELAERPLNISQIRRHGWTAAEVARATAALARLEPVSYGSPLAALDAALVRELVVWLATIGSNDAASFASDLSGYHHHLPSVPEQLTKLVELLRTPEEQRTNRLRAAVPDPVPLLIDLVEDITPSEREDTNYLPAAHETAIQVLGEMATDQSLRFLVTKLGSWSDDDKLFELARDALKNGGAHLVQPALDAWDDADEWVRIALIEALASTGVRDEKILANLLKWLSEADEDDRSEALSAIEAYGDPAALRQLVVLLDQHLERFDEESWRANQVSGVVFALGGTLSPAQLSRVRSMVERLLERDPIDGQTRSMLDHAITMLEGAGVELSPDQLARLELLPPGHPVITADGRKYGAHPPLPADWPPYGPSPYQLIEWARSGDPKQRLEAIQRSPNTTADYVKDLARDPDVEVRRELARRFGTRLSAVLLDDEDDVVRSFAVCGAPAERLPALAQDPSPTVRRRVPDHSGAGPLLEQLAHDPSPDVRREVAGSPGVTAALLQQLADDPDQQVRFAVAMGRSTPRELLHRLKQHDEDERVREYAGRALNEHTRLCDCCGKKHPAADTAPAASVNA